MTFNPIVIITKGQKPQWYKDTDQYARASWRCAGWQLANTLIPYAGLFVLMVHSVRQDYPYLVTLALAVCAAALFIRIFIFFHDCTHGAFLPSPRWNRNIGYLCGLLTFTAFHDWRRSHAGHHITAGNLDRRGIGDITLMTVSEYQAASLVRRLGYRLYRTPLITFGIGPLYYFLLRNRYPSPGAKKTDMYSVIGIDLALLLMITLAGLTIGWRTYLLVQGPILIIAAAGGIWLFFIQHQFQGVYWARNGEWDPWRVPLEGASYYHLPGWLHWATGNIGYHHVHHARPGIPNYRLKECHEQVPILNVVSSLSLRESLKNIRYKLWDEERQRLVSFHEARGEARAA